MNNDVSSLLIGLLVLAAIYLGLSRVFDVTKPSVRKALGVFSGVAGLLSTLWLRDHPDQLGKYTQEIVVASLAVIIVLLARVRK